MINGLASYAAKPEESFGRVFAEPQEPTLSGRNPFQRDRDRIVHSAAFRRLEYKTQVFLNHEGDHFRTRLTHSLEVAQIGRAIARRLHLNEDLVEGIALAHALGYTPFGHAGQDGVAASNDGIGVVFVGLQGNIQVVSVLTADFGVRRINRGAEVSAVA